MTTIAADARAGLMVSDSQWTDGDARGVARKVFRIRGALIGFAGALGEIEMACEWFKAEFAGAFPDVGVTALILRDRTLSTWTFHDGEILVRQPQFAIGTGGQCARAAMAAGADCIKAVRIACAIDANSGGRLRVYRMPDMEQSNTRKRGR